MAVRHPTPPRPATPPRPGIAAPPPFPPAPFTDQETLNRQFELFEQSHLAVRDFFLREDQLLGEERRKFEEWKQAQQAWLEQQNSELATRQTETKSYEEELQQLERDIQARERQTSKQQQTFQQNQRQLQLAQQQHAQQLQQQQQLIKQQQDQMAATQHNQAQQMAQLQAQEAEQQRTEAQLEQQRAQQMALREQLGQRAGVFQQQAHALQAQNQMAQAQALHNRASTRTLLSTNITSASMPPGGGAPGAPSRPAPTAHTYIQDREEPKSLALRQAAGSGPYTDPDFPPNNTALFSGRAAPGTDFGRHAFDAVWRRAQEIFPNGMLFASHDGGASGADIIQGVVGDMWFLNALACVATNLHMLRNLVVNEFPDIGMYEFRFWKGGRWITVVVDDFLPCSVTTQEPLCSRTSSGELWVPLLEKAFAKLHGAYQCLNGGSTQAAMVDLTGGAAEHIAMNTQTGLSLNRCGGVLEKLQQARAEGWPAGVTFKSEAVALGLLPGRAYPLIEINDQMVRLRNPWGIQEGPPEMQTSVFWLGMGDLEANLAALHIARTYNYNYGTPFYMSADLDGYWGGQNAGGQVSMSNPQYIVTAAEDCAAFVFLSQYDPTFAQQDRDAETNPAYRKPGFPNPNPNLCCGVFVLQCDASVRLNNSTGSVLTKDVVKYATFRFGRQTATEFRIPPGRSVVVMPAQFQAGVEAPYQLYVYGTRPFSMVKTLGEGMEQTTPLFSIPMSTPPPCISWDDGFRNRVIVERQVKGEVSEEDPELR